MSGVPAGHGVFLVWAKPGSGSRRAQELARAFGLDVFYLISPGTRGRIRGYLEAARRMMGVLHRAGKGQEVWVQVAPALAAHLADRLRKGRTLVLDSHSSFYQVRWALNKRLAGRAIRGSRYVLIHNPDHEEAIRGVGGRPFLLPDPLFRLADCRPGDEKRDVVLVPLSWRPDEPTDLVAAVAVGQPELRFLVTGRPRPVEHEWPRNVHLLGFVSDEEYAARMCEARYVLGITTQESTVLCAAHEALALRKRLVLSDTGALRWRFGQVAFLGPNTPEGLVEALNRARDVSDQDYEERVEAVAKEFEEDWRDRADHLLRDLRGDHGTISEWP